MIELPDGLSHFRPGAGMLLPVLLAFIALECIYSRLARHDEAYDMKETAASVAVAIGDIASRLLTGAVVAVPLICAWQHRLLDLPLDQWWTWLLLFVGVEFCYYWFHRTSHRVRWFWATHAVHHSATRFNLSAAIRLGWTGQLSGAFMFFLPLAWIGFHPLAIAGVLAIGLLYQFFLHTHLDVNFGPFEYVLNSPRHHRVHHAINDTCLDRNYGNVLIVFDRLFGTFAKMPADEPLRFGLKGRTPTNHPVRIALGEWMFLLADVSAARGLRAKMKVLLSPP